MSFYAYEQTIEHRNHVLTGIARITTHGRLLLAALLLGFGCVILLMWLAWRDIRDSPRIPALPFDAAKMRNLGMKVEHFCLRSTLTFVQGDHTRCQEMGKSPIGLPSCAWNFSDGRHTLKTLLDDTRAVHVLTVHGGHDPTPMRSNGELDSNFDLAYRRAIRVREDIWGDIQNKDNVILQFGLPSSRIVDACRAVGATESHSESGTNYDALRSPTIQVMRMSISS